MTCAVQDEGSVPNVALTCNWPLLIKDADLVVSTLNAGQRNRTVAPLTKPEPFTVKVDAMFAPVSGLGDTLVMMGVPPLMVNVAPEEVPPPGLGVNTVTVADPDEAMSLAGMVAEMAVVRPLLTVCDVDKLVPFHCTTELWSKVMPLTVRVNANPPAVALGGDNDVITGKGACTAKLNVEDVTLPGLMTCAVQVPGSLA